ncbi:hypothetical protein FF1_025182 [Malus domestica]
MRHGSSCGRTWTYWRNRGNKGSLGRGNISAYLDAGIGKDWGSGDGLDEGLGEVEFTSSRRKVFSLPNHFFPTAGRDLG